MIKNLLKTGEFAKLCHTTKETILHYDRKGILKPKYTTIDGTRFYGIEQFFEFDLISLMKVTGSKLEQIKDYKTNSESQESLDFLIDQLSRLREEEDKLSRRITMLEDLVQITEQTLHSPFDCLLFESRNETVFNLFPVDPRKMTRREECVECYSECMINDLICGNTIYPPLGMIIPMIHAIQFDFQVHYLLMSKYHDDALQTQQTQGTYAYWFHRGTIEDHQLALTAFLQSLEQKHLTIASDLYIYDHMNYALSKCSDVYIAKYLVKIKHIN